MKRNMSEWAAELMTSDARAAMPVMSYPGLTLTGLHVPDIIRDGSRQFRCIEALAGRYPSAGALTLMDLSIEAEAFGCPVAYSETDVPTVTGAIVSDSETVGRLEVPAVGAGRTRVGLIAAELAADRIADRPTFGGCIGPFSLAARLYGMSELMVGLLIDPETIHALLAKCTQFLTEYAGQFRMVGANGIVIAEPAAGLLSADQCEEFSSRYVRQIVTATQDDWFMVIVHNCGNTLNLVDSMVGTGARGFHFGNAVKMKEIMARLPADRLGFGNIDPASAFRNGNVDGMRDRTRALLVEMEPHANFVLSSGCDVPPGTPIANVEAFYETLARYNARRAAPSGVGAMISGN